jgi:hypothetical protein
MRVNPRIWFGNKILESGETEKSCDPLKDIISLKGGSRVRFYWTAIDGKRLMKAEIKKFMRRVGFEVRKWNPSAYDQDGLRTVHGHDFVDDRIFAEAYEYALNATKADPVHHGPWRVHIAMWAAKTALRRHGDFVECGTARAFVSTAILKYTNWNETSGGRHFYLVDTFEGLVEHLLTDTERAMDVIERHGPRFRNNYPDALRNVSPFKNVELIKGMVPNILSEVPARQVAYLHIDMNSALPEVAALEYFWPKIVLGGVILLDDYTYSGFEPQREALDELATHLGVEIASLPTGQGLLIK